MELPEELKRAREREILDAYRPICLCNKIRKGVIIKAIDRGAETFEEVKRKTGAGTGPCGASRCGPMIRGFLGEDVAICNFCGWSILKVPHPLMCPRCGENQPAKK